MDREHRDESWERVEARLDRALTGAKNLASLEAQAASARARRLESELHQQRRRAVTLLRIGRAINSVRGMPALLQLVADLALDACGAERGLAMAIDSAGEGHTAASGGVGAADPDRPPDAASRAVVERVCRTGVEIITADADEELDADVSSSVRPLHPRSVICVPIRTRDAVIGAIYVEALRSPDSRFHHDPDLLSTIADQAAIAIENSRLYSDLSKSFTKLSALKAQADEILESISSGVVVVDERDVVSAFNRAAEATFGVSAASIVGHSARILNTWLPGLTGLLERAKTAPDTRTQSELSGTNFLRGTIALRVTMFGLHDFAETGSGMAIVLNDVTASRALRAERLEHRERSERIAKSFERYLAPHVVRELMDEPETTLLGGTRQIATTLFADIHGFTQLAAELDPVEVVALLNRYLDPLVDVVFETGGLLDKFYGDGLMAVFGTPRPAADDALRAVRAAQHMLERVRLLNAAVGAGKPLAVSIGLATGQIVAGHIGSARRLEYTVIGDAVNLAARLEALAEPGQILVDERTYEKVRDFVPGTRRLATIKGKSGTSSVFVIHG